MVASSWHARMKQHHCFRGWENLTRCKAALLAGNHCQRHLRSFSMILHSAVLFAWVCSILWSRCVSHLAPRASHCAFSFSQQSRNPDFVPTSTSASSSAFASAFELIPGPCSRRRNPNCNTVSRLSAPVHRHRPRNPDRDRDRTPFLFLLLLVRAARQCLFA